MKTLRGQLLAVICSMLCLVQIQAYAQGVDDAKGKREVILMGLYPPDTIMRHQQRLGITDVQRRNISKAVQAFQGDVAELQWTMQNDQQRLKQYFSGYDIETDKALAQAERVLQLESEFKLAHFKLLIAIKNELTEKQIDLANQFVKRRADRFPE